MMNKILASLSLVTLVSVSAHADSFQLERNGQSYTCTQNPGGGGGTGGSEDWYCEESRDGQSEYDITDSRCRDDAQGNHACFDKIKRTCTDRVSGQSHSITNKVFVGCMSAYDCWTRQ